MKPSGEARELLIEELITKERTIEKMVDKLKADTKREKDKIKAIEGQRGKLLDLLEGREHNQPDLPFSPGKDGKKAAPAELVWQADGDDDLAKTPAGTYRIGPGAVYGVLIVNFVPTNGSGKKLGEAKTRGAAKELARKDWVERAADAILENAGDGKLTGKIRGLEKVK
jgi:hypothetical protein